MPEKYFLSKTAVIGILRRAKSRGKVLPQILFDALMETAFDKEDTFGENKIANAGEVLRELRQEAGQEAFEDWIRRSALFLQSEEILLSQVLQSDEDKKLGSKERQEGEMQGKNNNPEEPLSYMWEEWKNASSSHRQEPPQQLRGKLNQIMLELSRQAAPIKRLMCSVRRADEGSQSLFETLASMEKSECKGMGHGVHTLDKGCAGGSCSGIAFKERGGCAGGGKGILCSEKSFTVSPTDSQAVCYPIDQHQQDSRFKLCTDGIVPTMSRKMGAGGNNTPMVLEDHSYAADIRNMKLNDEICPTLQAKSNGGYSLNYTPPVIQPIYIDRAAFNQGKNAQYDPQFVENMATTLVAKGPGALCHENVPVAYSVGNGQLNQTEPELIAKPLDTMHDRQAVVIEKDQPRRYIIRRLTPLECGRLQGFPDFWLDGVKGSDTDKYKMWGNGMALPCMLAVLNGIKKSYGHNYHTGEVNG